jgi:hypothetical protein
MNANRFAEGIAPLPSSKPNDVQGCNAGIGPVFRREQNGASQQIGFG